MTVRAFKYEPTDPRLKRHVNHDDRSRDFAVEADTSALRTVRHHSHIGVLDQGQVGSCTGNAAVKCISHTAFWPKASAFLTGDLVADEKFAVGVYSDAEVIDGDGPYPPNDNGSSGLSVAKVLKNRGLIAGYQHAFSFDAFLTALSRQTVIVGIKWYEDMFNPDGQGFLSPTGNFAGGHELCIDQINATEEWVSGPNSWGASWGVKGRFKLHFDDARDLLADDGDCTVFQWVE